MNLDFSEASRIDHNNLDVECVRDAFTYGQWVKSMTDAEDTYDRAKDLVKVVGAEVDDEIRKQAAEKGEKITESLIFNKVLLHKKYREATEKMLQAKHTYNILKGAIDTLDKRSDRLESLIRLEARQYFAGPTVPRDLDSEMSKRVSKKQDDADRLEVERRAARRLNRKRGED